MKEKNFNWRIDNYVPIVLTIISWAFFAGIFITKLNVVIDQQKELTTEVKDWRKQFESRLGMVEINIAKLFVQHEAIK